MSRVPRSDDQRKFLADIRNFVAQAKGLRGVALDENQMLVQQEADGKSITIEASSLEDVLFRTDTNGTEFIQINFAIGTKILLTDTLVGFKPMTPRGLDLARLPRVVTTPDVINVFEAIQDALHATGRDSYETSILKKIYEAVLNGGEAVGFDLSQERSWLSRVPTVGPRASA